MKIIKLYGALASKFGSTHRLDVKSPGEAFRALCARHKDFQSEFLKTGDWAVLTGQAGNLRRVSLDTILLSSGRNSPEIHFMPRGWRMAGLDPITIAAIAIVAVVAVVGLTMMSVSLPKENPNDREDDRTSFLFDGPVNRMEQGHPVPLVYGRMMTGSVVIASSLETGTLTEGNLTGDWATGGFQGTGSDPTQPRSDDLYYLAKGGKGGSSARAAQEDPNTLQSNAVARILEIISEGEIVGLENGLQDVFFDETPVENPDGTFNFKGVDLHFREGLPDQDFVPGFANLQTTNLVGEQVTQLYGPVTETITDSNVDRARVTIRLPALWRQDTTNGDLKQHSVGIQIAVQANGGGFTTVVNKTFNGKNTAPYEEDFDIALPPGGAPWDVRVTRTSPDTPEATMADDVYFQFLTEIIDAKLSYPNTALVGMTVDAKQFGTRIPKRGYRVKGLRVEVPRNYNPETRTYATTGPGTSGGEWDGTFHRQWTDNPAWIYRDLALNRRYGLGKFITDGAVDKWSLYTIAQHCDGMVPDGRGGMEPRFTCNVVIDKRAKALKVLRAMAEMFDAITYWGSHQIVLSQDVPADPTLRVNPANVVGGEFNYPQASGEDAVHSAWVISFTDPEENYRQNYVIVQDDALVREIGWKPLEVPAYACTSKGQALRLGRRLRDNQRYRNRTVVYRTGMDHGFAMPGTVVAVHDPEFTQRDTGGRVVSATATGAVLDRAYQFVSTRTYTLSWITRSGTAMSRQLTNPGNTTTATVSFATPLTDPLTIPLPDAIWGLENDQVGAQQFRILTIVEKDLTEFEVTGIVHDNSKFARIEQGVFIEPDSILDLPRGPLLPPVHIGFREFYRISGDSTVPVVLVSWPASADPRVTDYELQVRVPGQENWDTVHGGGFLWRELERVDAGVYSFRVRGLDGIGGRGPWYIVQDVALYGPEVPLPGVVLSFRRDNAAVQTVLVWALSSADPRPITYEVYYHATDDFPNASSLGFTNSREWVVSREGWYYVVPRYMSFIGTPASIQITAGDLPEIGLTSIAGRTPEEVIAAIDSNALNLARESLLWATWRSSQEALMWIEGETVGAVAQQALEANENSAQSLTLLGARNLDNTAFILNADSVRIPAGSGVGSSAISLQAMRTQHDQNVADITFLMESFDGLSASVQLTLDVNGYINGLWIYNDGSPVTSGFWIIADNFAIVAPGDSLTSPFYPFAVSGGTVYMRNVVVDTIEANSITTENLQDNSVSETLIVVSSTTQAVPSNATWLTVVSGAYAAVADRLEIAWQVRTVRNGGDRCRIEVRIYRDGAIVDEFFSSAHFPNYGGGSLDPVTTQGTTILDDTPSGSHIYSIQIRIYDGNGGISGWTKSYARMVLTELKR